jgi:hypothetical protein
MEAMPATPPLAWSARLARHMGLLYRSMPYVLGWKKPCMTGLRNVPESP